MRTSRTLGLAFLAATACAEPTAFNDGVFTVTLQARALELSNASQDPLHYYIIEREAAAFTEWIFCAGPSCPAVPASGAIRVPHSQIQGWTLGAREATVYWWRAIPDGAGGLKADSIRHLIIPL